MSVIFLVANELEFKHTVNSWRMNTPMVRELCGGLPVKSFFNCCICISPSERWGWTINMAFNSDGGFYQYFCTTKDEAVEVCP